MKRYYSLICISLVLVFLLVDSQPAFAYIGPGAGFAFLTSFLMLFASFFMAFFTLLTWPLRVFFFFLKRRKALTNAKTGRVVILGLDGLEPTIVEPMIKAGKLPNLQKVAEQGSYSKLQTTYPAISPVAWSSFATGCTAGKHNIFDFLSRDKHSYMPELSSSKVGSAKRTLKLGKYQIPLGKPVVKLLRKSKTFWKILGDYGIFSHVLRVPITFPPEKFNGALLSAMCTPDLWGTQGTFSFFTSDESIDHLKIGGETSIVSKKGDHVEGFIKGPENSLKINKEDLKIPFTAKILNDDEVELTIAKKKYHLKKKIYTDWIELKFKAGLGIKVNGIARFYLLDTSPHFRLYMTPINIDPEKPALPIAYPYFYSVYLAKLLGKYATLGLAEDTWSLNEGILDEEAFLEQAYLIHEEREKQFFHALDKTKKGLCTVVIDGTDRIQHMFFRTLEHDHPANRGKETEKYKNVIEDLYIRMDDLVGRTMAKLKEDDVFFVISDHGFKSFKRCINLNTWLLKEGYLALKPGETESGEYFTEVDWSKTKAYAFGLAGIYLNVKGRERDGIVAPGEEYKRIKNELIEKLSGLKDPDNGEIAITTMYDNLKIYKGPYASSGPDLISGYNIGYRISWNGATGVINDKMFEDNIKAWSGDHCIDPKLVPGVIFCNKAIPEPNPALIDMAPSVLDLFGISKPKYMDGNSFFERTHKKIVSEYSEDNNKEVKFKEGVEIVNE